MIILSLFVCLFEMYLLLRPPRSMASNNFPMTTRQKSCSGWRKTVPECSFGFRKKTRKSESEIRRRPEEVENKLMCQCVNKQTNASINKQMRQYLNASINKQMRQKTNKCVNASINKQMHQSVISTFSCLDYGRLLEQAQGELRKLGTEVRFVKGKQS
jgi:hypothetical protein